MRPLSLYLRLYGRNVFCEHKEEKDSKEVIKEENHRYDEWGLAKIYFLFAASDSKESALTHVNDQESKEGSSVCKDDNDNSQPP